MVCKEKVVLLLIVLYFFREIIDLLLQSMIMFLQFKVFLLKSLGMSFEFKNMFFENFIFFFYFRLLACFVVELIFDFFELVDLLHEFSLGVEKLMVFIFLRL